MLFNTNRQQALDCWISESESESECRIPIPIHQQQHILHQAIPISGGNMLLAIATRIVMCDIPDTAAITGFDRSRRVGPNGPWPSTCKRNEAPLSRP
jgi:hypothetical protein